MKIFKFISFCIVITLCLTNTQCEDDDNFPPTIRVNSNTIVQIANNQNTFNVDESITVETNIPLNLLTTNGNTINLSDYDYNEVGQSRYSGELTLYKMNAFGTISKIPLTEENIANIEGETSILNGNISFSSLYNGTSYTNSFSIELVESGTYFLAGNRYLIDDNGQFRIFGGVSEFSFVEINSTIVNSNNFGGYEFTVN